MTNFHSQLLDRHKLDAAYITFSTLFDMQLVRTPTVFQDLATIIPVASSVTEFKWLGDVPKMTEWIGPRAIQKLRAETHQIKTKKWANGIEVDEEDLADDKLGLIPPRIQSLADEGMWQIEDLVLDLLNNGELASSALCYDGQPLFDIDHTASGSGGTNQSNLQAGGALSEANYQAAWEKMMAFKDTKGNSIRVVPDTLVVGVANRTVARKLINQQIQAAGAENIEAGSSRLIVHPRVTGTRWSLHSTMQAVRAIIVLIRRAPRFAAVDSIDHDTHTFMNGNFLYGADAAHGAGLGLWQTVIGSAGV